MTSLLLGIHYNTILFNSSKIDWTQRVNIHQKLLQWFLMEMVARETQQYNTMKGADRYYTNILNQVNGSLGILSYAEMSAAPMIIL